jgi:F0F1-type ATP synthase assembly protein I
MPPSPSDDESRDLGRKGEADAYGALGLVISGVLVWGGIGYLLGERFDNQLFVLVGLLLGMGGGLYLVWFRYGRQT